MADVDNRVQIAPRIYFIYALTDPSTGDVRYVGWTVNLRTRLRDHTKPSELRKGTYKTKWIASILAQGQKPGIFILEETVGGHEDAERRWIAHYRSIGAALTNATDGGEGAPGRHHTAEAKARMSEKRKGKRPSDNAILATIAMFKGKKRDPKSVEKGRLKMVGRAKSPEHCRKLSEAKRGKKMSLATRANMVAAKAKVDPEIRRERGRAAGAAMAAKGHTAETKRRMSEAKIIWHAKRTPEERSLSMRRARMFQLGRREKT